MKKLLVQVLVLLFLAPAVLLGADSTTFNPGAVEAKEISGVPIGGVVAWRSAEVPDGWLECNGQSTGNYPDLAALVGNTVPDLRGEFIRGWDNGRGIDPTAGRELGSWQNDELRRHRHNISAQSDNGPVNMVEGDSRGKDMELFTGYAGSDETRPRNVALMYIIRAE